MSHASLVYDGGGAVLLPPGWEGCDDQFKGTPLEQLAEVACRSCYDSAGYNPDGSRRGRSSAKLHSHILEVKHLNVYRHCNITVMFQRHMLVPVMVACTNRRGTFVHADPGLGLDGAVRLTANLQAVVEWDRYTYGANAVSTQTRRIGNTLKTVAHRFAPQIVHESHKETIDYDTPGPEDLTPDEAFVSLYLERASRGWSHEMVRHGSYAMSQRSTRYVDENGSGWNLHPLFLKYVHDGSLHADEPHALGVQAADLIDSSRLLYKRTVELLEPYCVAAGLDRLTARKQARGAARGFLGNALETEMLFTAPASGWRDVVRQRLSAAADAEIRAVTADALECLKQSRYSHMFDDMNTVPSPDGLGVVLA